jgi:hypothetical protein
VLPLTQLDRDAACDIQEQQLLATDDHAAMKQGVK